MSVTYLDRAAVARSIELMTEIRERYQQIMREFPLSDNLAYYREHVAGLSETLAILESTQPQGRSVRPRHLERV